jgi:hypothetical protein
MVRFESAGIDTRDQRPVIAAGVWGVIGSAICIWMAGLEPSLLEEGLILHVAERMLAGEHLYRDVVFFSGPFPFQLLAGLFDCFGSEIRVARISVALMQGISCAFVYLLSRRSHRQLTSHFVALSLASAPVLLFPLFSSYFYTTLVMHLCIAAVYAGSRASQNLGWSIFAGVLVALAALTKQTVSLVLAPCLLAAIALCCPPEFRRRQTFAYIFAGAGIAILTVSGFALKGDLDGLVEAMVVMPLSLGSAFSTPYINFWPVGQFTPEILENQSYYVPHIYNIFYGQHGEIRSATVALTQFLFALPFIALAMTAWRLVSASTLAPSIVFNAVAVAALLANVFPRSDWGHLVFVLPVSVIQILLCAGNRARSESPWMSWLAAGSMAGLTLCTISTGIQLYNRSIEPTFGDRVPQRPVSRAYKNPGVPRVIRFLLEHTQPGDPIFVARSEPLIYFATRTVNPTPFPGALPGLPGLQQPIITAALDNVKYVVMSEIDQPLFLYYRDELPEVQDYLERHYGLAAPFRRKPSWIVVYERIADRGETAIDFSRSRSAGRSWIRDERELISDSTQAPPILATQQNRRLLPLILGARGGGIDFDLEVPANCVFETGVGLREARGLNSRERHAARIQMQVSIRSQDDFEVIASRSVLSAGDGSHGWAPMRIDLARFAGRKVTLRLEAIPETTLKPGKLAWWGSPRLAYPPP